MEFLQRHLPRVYQAVQDALNFFTNVTAQMFGAPPNAPRPRDARTNVPIQTTKESGGLLAKEETQDNKGTCQVTSTLELSQATEENGASGRCHPDENHGTWETDLIHRKSDPGGTQDLDHKITKGEDIVLHTTVEVTTESYKVEVREFTESINIVTVSQDIQSIFDQEQVNPLDQRLEQENQASSIPCEIKVSQYEEELFHRTENLTDKAPLRNSERKVSKDEEHFRERSSDSQKEESFFQPATLYSLSSKNQKQLVDIIGQEEGKMTCLTEITTESEEYNINTDEEAQVLVDTIESTVTMEYDVNNILDVIETHKKLVTPADDIEYPPYSQEDSNKTLEDLVETANRLAKHCDSFKKTGNQKGFDTLPDSDETSGSAPAFALLKGQGCTEEDLTSMDASLAQNTFSTEQSESTQTSSEEESMKAQSLVPELSRFSEETNTITLEEGKDMSTKFKEKHQFKESETQPKVSKNKRTKRRVHFSPSTEDLFLRKSEQASRNTLQMVCDDILEGELQPSRENSEQLGSSCITKDLGSSPDKDGEEDYLGGGSCGYDDGQSTIEEQMNVVKEGRTMWYDDYSSQAEYDERCESLGDVTNQNEHFKMEESFMAVAETTSTEEHLDDIPSGEGTLSVVTSILEQTKLSAENKTESHAFQEDNFEKEYLIASDEATEAAFKEDPFLQEAKSQVDGLREERTYLLKDDTTYVKEPIDDINQSSNMLDTKDNGLQKDFIDELIQLDDRDLEPVIPDENNPAEDIDNTQLEIISHYSTYKHVTETGSSAESEAQKEFTSDQLSLQKNDKDFKSKQDEAEVEEDLTKSFQEKVGSSIVQLEEDTSLGQPVSRSSDDKCPEKLSETQVSTLVDEICMSVVEDVISGVGLPSEEHKDFLRDANFQGESETLDEISTHEMEEEEEYMNEKQNYDYKHEGFPPETIGSQEESKVKTGHIEPLTEHDEAEVQEDLMKSFQEQVGSSIVQLEEDTSLGQPVSRNSDDECSEILSETQVSTLVDLICMSVEEDVVLGGGLPSEEHSNILSDANLEDISSHEMEEKEEYMNEQHNHDYKHERFPPETNESQDEDRKVKTGPIEPLTEQCVAEEQHVADTEASLEEGLGNKQMQDDNEECPKECYEMDQSASLNEPFHNTLDVSAQKSRILLLRKTSVRRRPGQRPVTFQEEPAHPSPPATPPLNMGVPVFPDQIPALSLAVPPSIESSYPAEEPTDTSNASEPIFRRKSSVRRRGQRPATYQEELAESFMSGITSTQPTHPTEEPGDESTISEQILHRTSSIRRHQGQRPVSLGDNPVEPSLPVIMPLKMEVPNFVGGMPILSPAMAPTSEPSHPAKEPMDEGTTSEQMLRRKSSIRRSKVKKSVISEEQLVEPTQSVTAPLATVASQPVEELKEEKTGSEELAIKPKKGFLKHAGFGGAHPGMMQELQARLHKKKPKE